MPSWIGPWEIVIGLYIVPIFICAYIAEERERGRGIPMLAGVLFTWLGVVLVYLLLKNGPEPEGSRPGDR